VVQVVPVLLLLLLLLLVVVVVLWLLLLLVMVVVVIEVGILVMVVVVVLFADHVDLLVPARLSATAARRVVERQVHAGVRRPADPFDPTATAVGHLPVFFRRVCTDKTNDHEF